MEAGPITEGAQNLLVTLDPLVWRAHVAERGAERRAARDARNDISVIAASSGVNGLGVMASSRFGW